MSSTSKKEKWELLHIAWIVQFESNAGIPTGDPKVLIKYYISYCMSNYLLVVSVIATNTSSKLLVVS